VLYINDLPDNMKQHIKLYADDSKIIGIIETDADKQNLQDDIDTAVAWSHTWLMPFNVEKCKTMHIGRLNKSQHQYYMTDTEGTRNTLGETTSERDLGVQVSNDLKLKDQVETAASLANRALGRIKKSFRSRSMKLWRTLYLAYVRPLLEFAVQAWSPFQLGDIDTIEKVQRRATKTITAIKHMRYEDRLQQLGLTTLKKRRERGDLIQQFKLTRKIEEVHFFVPQKPPYWQENAVYDLRGHNCKLKAQFVSGCAERSNFFTVRVAEAWNALPQGAIDAHTVNGFKDQLSLLA
jgi:hypothetical protein